MVRVQDQTLFEGAMTRPPPAVEIEVAKLELGSGSLLGLGSGKTLKPCKNI